MAATRQPIRVTERNTEIRLWPSLRANSRGVAPALLVMAPVLEVVLEAVPLRNGASVVDRAGLAQRRV